MMNAEDFFITLLPIPKEIIRLILEYAPVRIRSPPHVLGWKHTYDISHLIKLKYPTQIYSHYTTLNLIKYKFCYYPLYGVKHDFIVINGIHTYMLASNSKNRHSLSIYEKVEFTM